MIGGLYEQLITDEQRSLLNKLLVQRFGTKEWKCPFEIDSMEVQGGAGQDLFKYVQVSTLGCNLGDECLPDDELVYKTVNFASLNTYPNLTSEDQDKIVTYEADVSFFKFIMPDTVQAANIFFMRSSIILQDNVFDILESEEHEQVIFEEK